jgi:hypothetical protein
METSGPYKLNIDHSNDSSEYKAGFHRGALYLIVAGHERLVAGDEDYCDTAEEEISGELTSCTVRHHLLCLSLNGANRLCFL